MAKKRQSQEEEGASWMDTYGDMITLVLTFFVLLYAMSNMDQDKWKLIAEAFSRGSQQVQVADKPNPENDPNDIYEERVPEVDDYEQIVDFEDFYLYLKEAIFTNELQSSVSVEMSNSGVYMRFRDNIFFAGDSDVLLDEGKFILEIISDAMRQVDDRILAVKVSGHTAVASNSDVNEWRLSSGRADSVVNFMVGLDACDESKFSTAGFGKYRPVDDNDTEEGRRQNRRVEIVFIRNDMDFNDPEVMKDMWELEFGKGFVQETNGDEAIPDTETPGEALQAVNDRSDPGKTYVSKEDVLSKLRE